MRFFCFLLLSFLIEISFDSTFGVSTKRLKDKNPVVDPHRGPSSPSELQTSDAPTRFLGSLTEAKQDQNDTKERTKDERVGFSGKTQLDELAYKLFLKLGMNPDGLYKRLRAVRAGDKLDNNEEFVMWLTYVMNYRAQSEGNYLFDDVKLFNLLTQTQPEDELVTLFHSLRQYPNFKNIADKMQTYMIFRSELTHRLINEAWLTTRETPQQIFNMLHLAGVAVDDFGTNPLFIQWLRYIEAYRAVMGRSSFSDAEMLTFLLKEKRRTIEATFGTFLQSIKDIPDLKMFARNMETHLYRRWMNDIEMSPNTLASQLGIPYSIDFTSISKVDPRYRNLEAYTTHFAEHKGGEALLDQVKKLFKDNDPYAALAAAEKA